MSDLYGSDLKIPKSIKMVVTDFDGIITDGCIYIDEKTSMSRKISFKDCEVFTEVKFFLPMSGRVKTFKLLWLLF